MVKTRVLVDNILVFTFPNSESQINSPQHIPVGVKATILQLTHEGDNIKYLTVCEVQVEECVKNKHGTNCTETCSSLCADRGGETTCDSITGNCFECQTGRWSPQCENNCAGNCEACDKNSGACQSCVGNFRPPSCTDCQTGWWGDQCNENCPAQCNGACDRNNGDCPNCNNHFASPDCTSIYTKNSF
ncbi:hypothetical protein BaRGS_00039755 [Batillaria attramentaria]|uniref:Uncharacterized protein n=1 Tax=Batillaria attramentaria TaxID=370345 RepID=A0ABD0J1Z4_9CAEN